ncbi:unnamed protein product [Musa textilis]
MDAAMKRLCLLALLAVAGIAGMERADAAGECGRVPVDRVAFQVVTPCGAATRDAKVVVPGRCCAAVQRFGRNPICLCAIMLSTTSKNAGVKPEIAVTIPKRCNLADRPVGYKCGGQLHIAVRREEVERESLAIPRNGIRTASWCDL